MKRTYLKLFKQYSLIFIIFTVICVLSGNAQSKEQPNGVSVLSSFRIEALVDMNGNGSYDTIDQAPLPAGTLTTITVRLEGIPYTNITLGNNVLSELLLNLSIGTYTLTLDSVPTGWIATSPMTINKSITLSLSEDTLRFLFFKKINVSGKAYNDLNQNGVLDLGEPGLSNWNMKLNSDSTLTDASGFYQFNNLLPGPYVLFQSGHSDWTITAPSNGNFGFTAFSGINISDVNFGNFQPGKFVIMTSVDNNGDGIFSETEITPLPNATNFMYSMTKSSGTAMNFSSGNNILTSYIPSLDYGEYTFAPVNIPSGWTYTSQSSITRTMTSGSVDTMHFLLFKNVTISGKLFEDVNGSGTLDTNETGLQGWGISLGALGTTYTDSLGNYSFINIGPGSYNLSENLEAGWTQTTPTDTAYHLMPLSGTNFQTMNFGVFKLGQFVVEACIDQNGNGTFETTDHVPLPIGTNVTLGLQKDGSTSSFFSLGNDTLSTTFVNLPTGSYVFTTTTIPSGWSLTSPNSVTRLISISGRKDTIRVLFFKQLSVSGTVFDDANANSIMDIDENGLAQWIVSLNNTTHDTTDSNGLFSFSGVGPGTHLLKENPKSGWIVSTPRATLFSLKPLSGVNISNLYFGNYQIGSISGMKFNDANKNGIKDSTELGIEGWKIVARKILTIGGVTTTTQPETTTTSTAGYYTFGNLQKGIYKVSEISQAGWVQTYPSGDGTYLLTLDSGMFQTKIDFGNTSGFSYIGTPGGTWSNPLNWEGNRVPTDTDAVYLGANANVVFDLSTTTTIGSLMLDSGATLTIDSSAGQFYVQGRFEIGEGSIFNFYNSNTLGKLYCDGDFINRGTFTPGRSAVYITGDNSKIIMDGNTAATTMKVKGLRSTSAFSDNHFYNLNISGMNDSTGGNIVVDNQLILQQSLFLRQEDTLFILNPEHDAITQNGSLPAGTVSREIKAGSNEQYRFESTESYVQFDGSSSMPTTLAITAIPATMPETTSLRWKIVPSTVNTSTNTIQATGIDHFSKWVAGKPGSGMRKGTNVDPSQYIDPTVARMYVIKAEGTDQFNATLQLRYDDSEVVGNEADLTLGRGAYYVDTVSSKWNMVSLPVVPDDGTKDSIFTNTASNAFSYNGGYNIQNTLTFGEGYWLKFPSTQTVSILGNDQSSAYFRVEHGWNMVGMISYPIDPAMTTLYADGGSQTMLSSAQYFGYRNGYYIADVLQPLRAYWIKVAEAGYIYMDKEAVAPKRASLNDLFNQLDILKVKDGAGNEQKLYFGFNSSADATRFEMPPSAPQGVLDARFATGSMIENAGKNDSKMTPILLSQGVLPYTLTWDVHHLKGSASIVLDGKEISMNETNSITIATQDAQVALKLTNNNTSDLPKTFALYQNYPNPFNPTTNISFDLPHDGTVSLYIYNVLGQQVLNAIENTEFAAGHYTFTLNTTNLASGVYFYKLQADGFTDMKKMVLTR